MCGIAGFCISDEYRENLNLDQLNRLMRAGICTNLHRGQDAVGFFEGWNKPSPNEDKAGTVWWKDAGAGDKHLDYIEEILRERTVPNVLALHTRAASGTFHPSHNPNNHPVLYNNVLATHNGYIRNHVELRKSGFLNEDQVYEKDKEPKVDSVVIAMLMDLITKPEEQVEDIATYLAMLTGGWASHVLWKSDPGLSLLVAGPSYPLTVQWSKGRLSYASEEATLNTMWNTIDQPFGKKAHARTMDTGTFMLVRNGEPIHYGEYDTEREAHDKLLKDNGVFNKPDESNHIRVIPKTGQRKLITKYKRGYKDEETQENQLWTSFLSNDPRIMLLYDASHGLYVNEDTQDIWDILKPTGVHGNFKFTDGQFLSEYADRPWADMMIEADQLFGFKRSKRDVDLYGWFGETEIITTDTGGILNIFDWREWHQEDRVVWEKNDDFFEKRAQVLQSYTPLLEHHVLVDDSNMSKFRQWFKKNSVTPKSNNKTGVVGVDSGKVSRLPIKTSGNHTGTGGNNQFINQVQAFHHNRKGSEVPTEFPLMVKAESRFWLQDNLGADFTGHQEYGLPYVALHEAFSNDPYSDVDEMEKEIVYHMAPKTVIPFMYNEVCPLHDQELSKHTAPLECEFLLLSTLALMNRIPDLTALDYLFYGDMTFTVDIKDTTYVDYRMCDHEWMTQETVTIEAYNLWWAIPIHEVCSECMGSRAVGAWPEVLDIIMKTWPVYYQGVMQS